MKKMTVTVNVIKSIEGLTEINRFIDANRTTSFEVMEQATGKRWENFGGFNGNIWDLWLRKKGTQGSAAKTFIRAYVKDSSDIIRELRWWGILPPATAGEIAENEAKAMQEDLRQKELIKTETTRNKAIEWLLKDDGNSHTRRTRWGNRAARLGADRSYGNYLRNHCHELAI